eukprot:Skav204648  [mRNA]  locus=scaffold3135:152900:153372:- [translate_table: standard]
MLHFSMILVQEVPRVLKFTGTVAQAMMIAAEQLRLTDAKELSAYPAASEIEEIQADCSKNIWELRQIHFLHWKGYKDCKLGLQDFQWQAAPLMGAQALSLAATEDEM